MRSSTEGNDGNSDMRRLRYLDEVLQLLTHDLRAADNTAQHRKCSEQSCAQ